jgi:outer membrane lipoprotein-sorting protein
VRYLPPKHDYPAQKTLVYIDTNYLVPIMIEAYDWDQKLSCRYVYRNVKFNLGLMSEDFLPQANEMIDPS